MDNLTNIIPYLALSLTLITAACSHDDAPITPAPPAITLSSCTYAPGDNTQNMDGSTSRAHSHEIGSPVYRLINTRQLSNGLDVTMDYMVHEPIASPKAIFILIAGGGLDSSIEGLVDGGVPTDSSGNFVVRSAHRYQAAGYRVITIDRPDDFASYAVMDNYRNSMNHAVDLSAILKRENTEGLHVIISGTSRGSISAVAMNSLTAGIAISSPLTSGSGAPIGSASLPLSRVTRDTHILLHTHDTCAVTLPANSRSLFDNLLAAGINVSGDEVNGGFQDTVRNDVCSGFDFHGFNGIETCAVVKETVWADNLITDLAANNAPLANNLAVNEGATITLSATDPDNDPLSYAVPYATTSLGGTVATDATGNVTYTKPVGLFGTVDTFAFTAEDGNNGSGAAVVSITLP